jgi:hypothetical protein
MNTDLIQTDLAKITPRLFEEAAYLAFHYGIATTAPLGYRGHDIYLFGSHRRSQISVNNQSGGVQLLITDSAGKFLSLGQVHRGLPLEAIGEHLYRTFLLVRPYIMGLAPVPEVLVEA